MRLEPYRLAREERDLELDLPLDSFPRLRDLVAGSEGPVAIRAHFERDEEGRCRVTGRLRAALRIRCANCLEDGVARLDLPLDLCVVGDPDRARSLIGQVDPVIIDGTEATPAELFEDDLLLGLPERPTDHQSGCPNGPTLTAVGPEPVVEERRENPFAVLASLKESAQDARSGSKDGNKDRN